MTQNSNKINFWRGTRFVFERKIQRNELIVGTVYFVGNSMEDVEGTGQSTYGVIYQAVSDNRAVRYGIFATDDDITRLIEELTEKIDEEGEERREADENITERIAHLIPEVADAVENHMAIFDSDGRLKDSGRDIVEFLMDGDIDDATIKFENGKLVVQNYSHRHHVSDIDGLRTELDTKMGNEMLGTSNGIATLDENAKVNLEQMPYRDGYGIDITVAGEIKTEPISDAEIDAMSAGERNGHLLDNLGLVRLWNRIVAFFVQKEDGKGLSSNDYTDAEKNKLAGIEQGAEVNVQSDWSQTNTSADDYIKNKPSVYTKTEIDQMFAANVKYEVVSTLPSTGTEGVIYLVPSSTSATGDVYDEYMWIPAQGSGSSAVAAHFEKIGSTKSDFDNYYTKSEADTLLAAKQATLPKKGSTTKPVYISAAGTLAECSTYAGGTKVTLNGSDKGASTASMYAPTAAGTAGQYLKSAGDGAPTWETMDTTPTASSTKAVTSGGIKTALDAKQNSISITTNTSTPADNDTVIMQASGTTNTTSFLRRTMSKIWDYIKSKADEIYYNASNINNPYVIGYPYKYLSNQINDQLWGADKRWTVTWNTYDSSTDEVIPDMSNDVSLLFNGNYENSSNISPLDGMYDIIEITTTSTFIAALGLGPRYLLISFYYKSIPPSAPEVTVTRYLNSAYSDVSINATEIICGDSTRKVYSYNIGQYNIKKIKIKVIGKTYASSPLAAHVTNISLVSTRSKIEYDSAVTKHAVTQNLYGEVVAPKFTMRGGTSQEVLLANGATINMPSTTGTNKDTLLKNLISGLSVAFSDVTDTMEIVTSSSGVDGFGTAGQVNVPFKRRMTKVWDYIKGKADLVYSTITETNKKANRVIDHTWNQPSYSASAGGTHVKICDIPSDCVCVMNVRKSVYGYPSINTLWIGNNNSLDFKSLTETDIVATVSSRICTLSVPAHTASGIPLHTYDFEISVLNKDDLSAITWYDDATYYSPSRPTKPNIVMQQSAPVTDGSLAFNVNSSTHVASVSVDGYTDFVGMLTEDSTSAVLVKLSDEAEGSVYRFTFDHAIEGGVSFSNSNASTVYCEVSQDIHAGDTITLTAVSNTADGWIASVSSAGIISSDSSVGIEWENGVADLSVPVTPPNVVLNRSELNWEDDEAISIGKGSSAIGYSGDDNNPYAYTDFGVLQLFKVNGGSNEYYHEVTAGTTYSITVGSYTVPFTPDNNGYAIVCNLTGTSAWLIDSNHMWALTTASQSISFSLKDATAVGTSQYCLGVVSSSDCLTASAALTYWYKTTSLKRNIAIGYAAKANGMDAMTINGISRAQGAVSIGYGSKAYAKYNVAIGYNARAFKSNAVAIGDQASAEGDNSIAINAKVLGSNAIAIGYDAQATANFSSAIGSNCKTNNSSYSVAMGYSAQTNANYATAIGEKCQANGDDSIALGAHGQANGDSSVVMGRYAKVGYKTSDASYPQYKAKRFNAVSFTEGGTQKYYRFLKLDDSPNTATITVNGTTIELTPPNGNVNFFIVVNDSSAPLAYRNIGPYMLVDKTDKYITNSDTRDIAVTQISGNYYAMWLHGYVNDLPQTVSSISLLTYVKSTAAFFPSESYAIGYETTILYRNCIAMGRGAVCAREGQIILGSYCIPNEKDRLIVSGGTSGNNRKNVLTIDDNEVMHVRGIVNEVRTIDTGGTSASVTQIKQGVLKVTGGGSLGLSTTGAVEGLSVKIYASGASVMMPDFSLTITAGRWHEFIFLDGAWSAQM